MFINILGNLRAWSYEGDPFVIKRDGLYQLYSHDLRGIKLHTATDGEHYTFQKYIVTGGYRPFVHDDLLYYEKFTEIWKFPINPSHIRVRNLATGEDKQVLNKFMNHCCPSIINDVLFFSTGHREMDYKWTEPKQLLAADGTCLVGLPDITCLRKFGDIYIGTLITTNNGISDARIVECIPKSFPYDWKIGDTVLEAKDISDDATHVYIASIIDNKLFVNVRFGRNRFSSERIVMTKWES